MWLFLVSTVLLKLMSKCYADTFKELCAEPVHFGSGVWKDDECEVLFPMETRDLNEALSVCEESSPFDVSSYRGGFPTKCTYVKTYTCNKDEVSVGDNCFKIETFSDFNRSACQNKRKLYVIQSTWELKWISILLGAYRDEVWISNAIENRKLVGLKPLNEGEIRVKLRLRPGIFTRAPTIDYEYKPNELGHLCSRPAVALDTTVNNLFEMVELFGYTGAATKDNTGRQRAFSVIPLMLPVRTTNGVPNIAELHSVCRLFPHGYVASLNDLSNPHDFKEIRKQLGYGLYRTTVGRMVYPTAVPTTNCKQANDYKNNRKYWIYADSTNDSSIISADHWDSNHPDSMCADLPRTTAAMDELYVDIPSIARRPLLCTYGNPPSNLPPFNPNDLCNKAAHFDRELNRCVCNNPNADARVKFPEKYATVPEGMICFDCVSSTPSTSIVIIVDYSVSHVGEWKYMRELMLDVVRKIGSDHRVALVVLTLDSYVAIPMDYYYNNKDVFEEWNIAKKEFQKILGIALYEARKLLQNERTAKKLVIIFSDGAIDNAPNILDPSLRNLLIRSEKHTIRAEKDELHKLNVEIIYVMTKYNGWITWRNKTRLEEVRRTDALFIVRKEENIVRAENYRLSDDTRLKKIISPICKMEK